MERTKGKNTEYEGRLGAAYDMLLNTRQAADYLGCSMTTVLSLIHQRLLVAYNNRHGYLILASSLREYQNQPDGPQRKHLPCTPQEAKLMEEALEGIIDKYVCR